MWRPRALSTRFLNRRRLPRSVEDGRAFLFWPVKAEHRDEATFGGGEPVGFFVAAGVVALQVEVDRAVFVFGELVAGAERVAVQRIIDEEHLFVVHREGPEAVDGRELATAKVHDVLFVAHVGLAIGGGFGGGIDGVFRAVCAEADRGDEGALQVVGAVEAGFGGEGPAVYLAAGFFEMAHDFFEAEFRDVLQRGGDLVASFARSTFSPGTMPSFLSLATMARLRHRPGCLSSAWSRD